MTKLYSSPDEEATHAGAILSLAEAMHQPVSEVARAYEAELELLKADARIPDFLVVFASRRARDRLRNRRAA